MHDLFRRRVLGNTREAANIGKEHGDRLGHTAQLERVRIVEQLLHDVLRQEPAVVGARNFFAGEAFVRPHVLDGDCRLGGDGADQFKIVGLES